MNRVVLESGVQKLWYGESRLYRLLLPLAWLYCGVVRLRRAVYRAGLLKVTRLDCKVVIVGNIVAGGSGKTPLVIALADCLQKAGLKVGLLCSGYRGRSRHWPRSVNADSDPGLVGDEAVLLARKTGLPVMAGADRVAAGRALLKASHCDVLLCDDGLQHYALYRDMEIIVTDAGRGFGNAACLPAGPLREPLTRLQEADAVLGMGGECPPGSVVVRLETGEARRLDDPSITRPLAEFSAENVQAMAGIANPAGFFGLLRNAGLNIQQTHAFDDHHAFVPGDLPVSQQGLILMTEKDALKCETFSRPDCWYLPVEVQLDAAFEHRLIQSLSATES